MAEKKKGLPKQYKSMKERFPKVHDAVSGLGKAVRAAGPIKGKEAHLIQMAAAAAIKSQGSVHSHARRAIAAGAKPQELYHAVLLLTSTIGFPNVSAAISWIDDVIANG